MMIYSMNFLLQQGIQPSLRLVNVFSNRYKNNQSKQSGGRRRGLGFVDTSYIQRPANHGVSRLLRQLPINLPKSDMKVIAAA